MDNDDSVRTDDRTTSVGRSAIGDQPTSNDDLGFGPYVQAVAAFLTYDDTRPPLTLSVEGSWGSGKSSFMLQLEECIRKTLGKRAKTVWFNAWRYDRDDELWAAFAVEFTNKLAAEFPWWKRLYLHLKLSFLRFDWRRGWLRALTYAIVALMFLLLTIRAAKDLYYGQTPLKSTVERLTPNKVPQNKSTGEASKDVSPIIPANQGKAPEKPDDLIWTFLIGSGYLGYAFAGLALARKVADLVGNPLKSQLAEYLRDPKYETRTAFLDSFHADFKRLTKTYAEGSRIYVFVDDLDRCEIPKAAELMQAINLLVSESTPMFYILGLDRQKVAAGLAAKYEKILPYLGSIDTPAVAGITFGYTFLEKFIQVPFFLPQPTDTDIDRLLNSLNRSSATLAHDRGAATRPIAAGLMVKLGADSDDVRAVVKMTAPALEHNPRRIKQFINLFRLRALLASQTGLFGSSRDPDRFDPLTFQQLGKLVAIALRWPRVFDELQTTSNLLERLQRSAWATDEARTPMGWEDDKNLMDLIAYPGLSVSSEVQRRGDLGRVDLGRFLQIAPIVPGRESMGSDTDTRTAPTAPTQNGPLLSFRTSRASASSKKTSSPDADDVVSSRKGPRPSGERSKMK